MNIHQYRTVVVTKTSSSGNTKDEPSSTDPSSSIDAEQTIRKDHAHCVDLVKTRDREGYLCGLLMPKEARIPYFALRAFNVEIASIKDNSNVFSSNDVNSSETTSLGSRLRMQWWRDALEVIYDDKDDTKKSTVPPSMIPFNLSLTKHPVVRSLQYSVQEKKMTRKFLERMLDARESDLDVSQLDTMDELVRYSEMTVGSLLYLTLESCNVINDEADDVACNIGIGIGIVNTIRSIAYRAASNRKEIGIPKEVMATYEVPERLLLDTSSSSIESWTEADRLALTEAVREMASVARLYLQHGRVNQRGVPKGGRVSFLPAVTALNYLDILEGCDHDIFSEHLISTESLQSRLHAMKNMLLLFRGWLSGVF